jgi:hypothetical protein
LTVSGGNAYGLSGQEELICLVTCR